MLAGGRTSPLPQEVPMTDQPAQPDDQLPDDVGDDDLELEVPLRPDNDGPANRDAASQDPEVPA